MVGHLENGELKGVRIHINAVANEGDRVDGYMVMNTPPGWTNKDLRVEMVKMLAAMEAGYGDH